MREGNDLRQRRPGQETRLPVASVDRAGVMQHATHFAFGFRLNFWRTLVVTRRAILREDSPKPILLGTNAHGPDRTLRASHERIEDSVGRMRWHRATSAHRRTLRSRRRSIRPGSSTQPAPTEPVRASQSEDEHEVCRVFEEHWHAPAAATSAQAAAGTYERLPLTLSARPANRAAVGLGGAATATAEYTTSAADPVDSVEIKKYHMAASSRPPPRPPPRPGCPPCVWSFG